ncbi:MAG: hypothetical protein B6243_09395 [Anaerolineaceae bacterium 4572_5.2]|nr:MAG: hypothetical protein B6243_09395 [Anaerolineaceae bacterium 4572_5.2]
MALHLENALHFGFHGQTQVQRIQKQMQCTINILSNYYDFFSKGVVENMDSPSLYIIIGIAVLIVLGLIFVIYRSKAENVKPDYRTMFILGAIWFPLGIALENPGSWGLGIVFMIAGLVNKDKWKEEKKWSDLTSEEQKIKLILIIGIAILLLIGVVAYFVAS